MIHLSSKTIALLEDIERRIDVDSEEDFLQQWNTFLDGNFTGDIFEASRKVRSHPSVEVPHININDALDDYELMLVRELEGVSRALEGPGAGLQVRTNYGSAIMTSLFGAKVFTMPYETDTLPTTHSFNDTDAIEEILDRGVPDFDTAFGRKVFEMGEVFAEVFAKYPKIAKYVMVYHPDTQGPLDILELLWGEEMFYAMFDEPELVHNMMKMICETYTGFMNRWLELFPNREKYNPHWGVMFKGGIVLRNDSAMNLSAEFYHEFAKPYDRLLLQRFGGGIIHFCGHGDHYIPDMCTIPELTGINMSQPHLNDMEIIYSNTVDRGLDIVGFRREFADRDVGRPGAFHGRLHSATL